MPFFVVLPGFVMAQNVSINNSGALADASAMLDIKSNTKGLLIPRMLLQERTAIVSPAKGLIVYQTNETEGFYYNAGTPSEPNWTMLNAATTLTGGNAGYLAKWTSASTIGNSLFQDNGIETSINGSPVSGTSLHVYNTDPLGIGIKALNLASGTALYAQAGGDGTAAIIDHLGETGTALSVITAGAYSATFNGGHVGIGTSTPTTDLQISNTSAGNGPTHSMLASTTGTSSFTMGSTLNSRLGYINYDNAYNRMSFGTSGVQQLSLTQSGLAIGQNFSAPQNLIHLFGGNSPAFMQFSNNASGASTSDGLLLGLSSTGEGYIAFLEPHDFRIQTNGVNSLWMNQTGKVGIYGKPDSAYSVLLYNKQDHPAIGLTKTGVIIGDVEDSASSSYMSIPFETNSNIMLMGGNVGIGLVPTQKLEVNGNIQIPAGAEYKYAAAKTHYYSVPALLFQPDSGSFTKGTSNGSIFAVGGTSSAVGYFTAPVNLPDGATVTCVSFYEVDNDGTYNLQSGQLCRNDASTNTSYGNVTVCANVSAPGGANADIKQMNTYTISNPVIDNQNYTYYLRWGTQQDNPNLRLVKVLITYNVVKAD